MGSRDLKTYLRDAEGDPLKRALLESAKADAPNANTRAQALSMLAGVRVPPPATGLRGRGTALGGGSYLHAIAAVFVIGAGVATLTLTTSSRSAGGARAADADAPAVETAAPASTAAPVSMADSVPSVTLDALPSAAAPPALTKKTPLVRGDAKEPATPAAARPQSSTLSRELAMIEAARTAFSAGDTDRTLALLGDYDVAFPSGTFAVDVAVLRIEALARAGRADEARALGNAFLESHRQGAFARRIANTLDRLP